MPKTTSTPDCPFCRTNNLLSQEVLAETEAAFLVQAQTDVRSYLAIPVVHVESPADLPGTWWQDLMALLAKVPEPAQDYNISINIGRQAGQSVKHLHFWVIKRGGDTPASGKGFARLIDEVNRTAS